MNELQLNQKSSGIELMEKFKSQIAEMLTKTTNIIVVDKPTADGASSQLAQLAKLVKEIDTKRAEIKKPVLEAAKEIDDTAKSLSEPIAQRIAEMKGKLKDYNDKVLKEIEVAQKKAEQERLEKARLNEAKNAESLKLLNALKSKGDAIMTEKDQKKIYDMRASLTSYNPPPESFGIYHAEAIQVKQDLITIATQRIKELINPANPVNTVNAEKIQEEAKQKQLIFEKEREIQNAKAKSDEEAKQKQEIAKLNASAPSNTRTTWVWEISDENLIPREFLQVNNSMITQAVRNGVRSIPGITIKQETTIISK